MSETSELSIVDDPNTITKEREPRDKVKVGVHAITSGGGNGDIATGAKVVDRLNTDLGSSADVKVYTTVHNRRQLDLFSSELRDVPVIEYSRGQFNMDTSLFEHPPKVNGALHVFDEDIMILLTIEQSLNFGGETHSQ